MTDIQKKLFKMQDLKYRDFHSRLMPTVDRELIIGIRTPRLRRFANEFAKTGNAADFLQRLPHKYYEENNLHAFIIEKTNDFDKLISLLDVFLPYIDNWATCDTLSPKLFKKNKKALIPHIHRWISSAHTYTVRFAIV
ncbi:MAG: DNA alkylation repair protein, partial [Oscillospiraceae bacterium]|nr:DNA alkylation repair protein [Oscillospiraceae bacterium]